MRDDYAKIARALAREGFVLPCPHCGEQPVVKEETSSEGNIRVSVEHCRPYTYTTGMNLPKKITESQVAIMFSLTRYEAIAKWNEMAIGYILAPEEKLQRIISISASKNCVFPPHTEFYP